MAATEAEARKLWQAALPLPPGRVDPDAVSVWIDPLVPLGLIDQVLVLGVTDDFAVRWVRDNDGDVIRDALHYAHGRYVRVGYRVVKGEEVAA